jgi:uncharacterized membrane protein
VAEAEAGGRAAWQRPWTSTGGARAGRSGTAAARALRPSDFADVLAAEGLALVCAFAAAALPAGSVARIALAGLLVFVLPGFLAMEALFPPWHGGRPGRATRAAMTLGLSPSLAALAALSTALVPGGFRPANLLAAVVLTTMAVGVAAIARRRAPGPRTSRRLLGAAGRQAP